MPARHAATFSVFFWYIVAENHALQWCCDSHTIVDRVKTRVKHVQRELKDEEKDRKKTA